MTETCTEVIGWHFAAEKLRDGRPLPKAGETLTHDGLVEACRAGLHASARAIDALAYAPGFHVARVRLSGTVVSHGDPADKYAASERTNLTDYADAREVIIAWAFAVADKAVRVDAVAALRTAAGVKSMPRTERKHLLDAAESLEKLPTIDSSAAAWAARAAAAAARDEALAASDAALAASAAAAAARDEALAASDAAWAASAAAGAASDAAGAASDAAWAASDAELNADLERRLSELFERIAT